jgi:hypothetical protein
MSEWVRKADSIVESEGECRPPMWSEFLATDLEVTGSIPGTTRCYEK